MFKIYSAYIVKIIFDTLLMVAILYSVARFILGPDISEIINSFVKGVF